MESSLVTKLDDKLQAIMRDLMAEAWDEGFSHATGSVNSDDQYDNPYRDAS